MTGSGLSSKAAPVSPLRVGGLDDKAQYDEIRADFEEGLIAALKQCDEERVFGNRAENGIVLFAFYIDDYDGNDKKSLLYRSAKCLNREEQYQQAIDFTGC